MSSSSLLPAATLLLSFSGGDAYCNGMHWPKRTSKAFPPGWNGLSKTPVRGWRSWYAYYTHMNQGMIEEVIDALTAKNRTVEGFDHPVSLCDLGYCMVGIDEGWEGCGLGVNKTQHYLNGTPATNPTLFPDMPGLVRYGHAHGLKMGWYFNGCGCMERTEPASGWDIDYEGDVRQLHALGFDAVKFDGCGRLCNLTFYAELMASTGRAYEIENCHWGKCTDDDASSCPTADWCPFNFYRTSGDSDNRLSTWFHNLQTTVRFQSWAEPVSRPGCWAYPDMLQVGRLGCGSGHTSGCPVPSALRNWTRAHFAAFCIVSSPLVLSIHPSDATLAPLLDIIGNPRAMAINQAWAGHPGSLVRTLAPAAPPVPPVRPGDAVVSAVCDDADATQAGWSYDAARHALRRGERCLSTDGLDLPLRLEACGNTSTHQNFSYDASSGLFHTVAPAPTRLYPACLQLAPAHAGAPPAKADVYKCEPRSANQRFDLDATGRLRTRAGGVCAAARDRYAPAPAAVAGVQLWAKPLGGGRTAALFLNGGALAQGTRVTLAELNISAPPSRVTVRDVWTGADAGAVEAGGAWPTGLVPPLDAAFVIFEVARFTD